VNEELEPAEAEVVVKQLPSHKNKETCICIEKRIINTNTAQITALDSSNNTLDALPATWTWKNISELRHQALHPTETSSTRVPFRQATRAVAQPD